VFACDARGWPPRARDEVGAWPVGAVRVSAEAAEKWSAFNASHSGSQTNRFYDITLTPTAAGEPVVVQLASHNSSVRIAVSDRGLGIAAADQHVIFEKFGRVNRSGSESKPGTGLGLFIARSIAEAHGGALEVASVPGAGSTFTLRLPS
jgi:signal transduction histidine kinase